MQCCRCKCHYDVIEFALRCDANVCCFHHLPKKARKNLVSTVLQINSIGSRCNTASRNRFYVCMCMCVVKSKNNRITSTFFGKQLCIKLMSFTTKKKINWVYGITFRNILCCCCFFLLYSVHLLAYWNFISRMDVQRALQLNSKLMHFSKKPFAWVSRA